jgi:hypothetical protein
MPKATAEVFAVGGANAASFFMLRTEFVSSLERGINGRLQVFHLSL